MEEMWKPVPYEPFDKVYSVSNLGRVKPNVVSRYSKNKAEFLKPVMSKARKSGSGRYPIVTLYADGKSKCAFVHQMVALAFIGPKPFPDAIVCHKDDVKTNNRADNLEWGTHKSNAETRESIGVSSRGEGNGHARLTEDDVRAIRTRYAQGGITQGELAQEFGVYPTNIHHIVVRRTWRHV